MATLLELKQILKSYYVKFEFYITLVWKFILTLITLNVINSKIGCQEALTSPLIVLMCSLLCAILPQAFIVILSGLFIMAHLWALSMETAVIALAVFLIMYLLYYRFSPNDSTVLVLTALGFCLHIPYVMPLAVGLLGSAHTVVSVAFGVVVYYYLGYIADNTSIFMSGSADGDSSAAVISRVQSIVDGVFASRVMISVIAVFAITTIIVYILRRLSIKHSWDVAIVAGTITLMIGILVANVVSSAGFSVIGVILGAVLAGLLMKVLEFFVFNLDYKRIENVQFEDDDYYYYVKAIPKVSVATPDRKVKQINRATAPRSEERTERVERTPSRQGAQAPRSSAQGAASHMQRTKAANAYGGRTQQPRSRVVSNNGAAGRQTRNSTGTGNPRSNRSE